MGLLDRSISPSLNANSRKGERSVSPLPLRLMVDNAVRPCASLKSAQALVPVAVMIAFSVLAASSLAARIRWHSPTLNLFRSLVVQAAGLAAASNWAATTAKG